MQMHPMETAAPRPAIFAEGPGDGELKRIADKLTKAFEDYKKANDDRLAELESRSTVTPEMQATLEKADKEIANLKAQWETAQADWRKALEDVELRLGRRGLGGAAPANDEARVHAANFFTARNAWRRIERRVRPGDADLDLEAYAAYREAFEAAARGQFNPEAMSPEVRNAMSVGSDPAGGYFVPDEMATEMVRRIHETSPMRQVSRVITIGAPAWEAPWKSSKGTSGGWVGEQQSRTSTATPTVGMQRIETHEQYAYPEVTQAILDDAAIDIEGFLVEDTEEEMARQENTAFVSGTGVMKPRGFLDYKSDAVTTADASRDWGVLEYIASGAAGAFPTVSGSSASDPDALITTIARLNPAYRPNARWFMNRATEAVVRKLKDADGRYLVGFGDLRDNALGFSLLGFPIVNLEDMPDVASDSYSIAFGDMMRGYLIVDRIGFRVLRDPYTNKPYVGFYITKRTGGDVRNFDAIKLMKFAAS